MNGETSTLHFLVKLFGYAAKPMGKRPTNPKKDIGVWLTSR